MNKMSGILTWFKTIYTNINTTFWKKINIYDYDHNAQDKIRIIQASELAKGSTFSYHITIPEYFETEALASGTYYYVVTAVNSLGESADSAEVDVTR